MPVQEDKRVMYVITLTEMLQFVNIPLSRY